ncbi:outer membrane protein [Pararhodobacter sp.]|uniref:outer membrane protein n=1 Tax=Pararhodobacter sp. TaxID=2127056 RepID=UPI002AFFEBB4|nr:outer membrane beta-barrel protein [Pararhodobacter sp.]
MKKVFLATIMSFTASASFASGPVVVSEPPMVQVPVYAAAPDWSGVYGGVYHGRASGEMFDIGGPYDLDSGSNFTGLFLGYRHDMGDYVVGGEISSTVAMNMQQAAFPTWEFERMTDIRATVGRDFGRTLVYVAGGYTTSTFSPGGGSTTYNGWNLGIGLDYRVTDRFFVGVEYVHRDLSRSDLATWTGEFGTVQIRAGFQF